METSYTRSQIADLSGPGMSPIAGMDLRRKPLSGLTLRDLDLRRADLFGADLHGTDLRGTDLRGANLAETNLRETDLRGVHFYGADLCGADLRGAELGGAALAGAVFDYRTRWPTGFDPVRHGVERWEVQWADSDWLEEEMEEPVG